MKALFVSRYGWPSIVSTKACDEAYATTCGTKKATKCGLAQIGAAGMAEHFGHERLKVYQKGGQG